MEKTEITALVQRSKSGDKEAFLTLYKEFHGRVSFFVRRLTNNTEAAADITSDTFTDAMERIAELNSGESFSGWLYSIAYNKCMQYINEKKRSVTLSSEAELEELLESAALNEPLLLPEDYAISSETRAQLQGIIDGLSPDQRSAVIMYYYDEMSVSEVAEAMGTNENNVSQKLHRARKKIRAQVEKLIGRGAMFGAVPMGSLLRDLGTSGVGMAAVGAAAVGIPYGLSKASGGTARELLWITRKYWSKHKKNLAALLFSGVLLCAVVCCAFLMLRQNFNRYLHMTYDNMGNFSYMLDSKYEREIAYLTDNNTVSGKIYCYGKTGAYGRQYTYGSLDDPFCLAHIPLAKGRLPENAGETAIDKNALERLGFYGTVGDEITFDTGTYTLVGIIDGRYGQNRPHSEIASEILRENDAWYEADEDTASLPMIFIAPGRESEAIYSYTMLDNDHPYSSDELYALREDDDETFFPSDMEIACHDKSYYADIEIYQDGFYKDLYHLYYISGVAALVAVLSVISVLRNVFAERENSIAMLRRIGASKRHIRVMYTIECLMLCVIQTVIGLLLGCAVHFGIFKFQTAVLEMSSYSGFTTDEDVLRNTVSPFLIAAVFSFAAMIFGYGFSICMSHLKAFRRRRKKAGTLFSCVSRAFANKAVTVIQTFSLALICLGTILGYMVSLEYGWYYNEETGEYTDPVNTLFGSTSQFDFDEDGVEEYYSVNAPDTVKMGSFTFAKDNTANFGIDDTTASKLNNAISTGYLPQTFIISDSSSALKNSITYGSNEEKDFFRQYSSEQGKALIDSDKTLYKCPTKLVDITTVNDLSQYVVQGSINADKLMNGEEIILVVTTDEIPLAADQTIILGSSATTNGFGIESVVTNEVRVGALVSLPKSIDRISKYAVYGGDGYSLLTTVSGAKKLGLHNAAYTEVFAKQALKSGEIPMGTGMTMTSYSQRSHDILIADLSKYGSAGLLIFVMSLLGFAAYFNGIGMKIRLKEYQISVMRAVGTPLKRLRRKLIFDAVKIPIAASAIAFGGIKLIQRLTLVSNEWYRSIQTTLYDIPAELEGNWTLINQFNDMQMKWEQEYVASHLINDKLWFVPVVIPTLTVFAVMCIVTILLTRKSFRMFTPDIAGALARGRKRR